MPAEIFTIGHSNHPMDVFLHLLHQHGIQVVVDTRSQPYSKFSAQYNSAALRESLAQRGIGYLYMGRELGGRPEGAEFYDADGHVLYWLVAETPLFRQGIERLEKGVQQNRIVLLCSEENPAACHRRLLVGRVLLRTEIAVSHIRGDGRVQSEEEVAREHEDPAAAQLHLFEPAEAAVWKSIPSVSPRKRLSASSGR